MGTFADLHTMLSDLYTNKEAEIMENVINRVIKEHNLDIDKFLDVDDFKDGKTLEFDIPEKDVDEVTKNWNVPVFEEESNKNNG